MKKTILSALVMGVLLSSCTDNGEKVEASDAEQVEVTQTETTLELSTIAEGSHVDWRASHLGGVAPRWGKISLQSAELLVNNGDLTNAKVVMDMGAFTVENFEDDAESTAKLTGHLQSADFFEIETYPTSTFEMTGIEATEGDFNSKVTGNLEIKGVTKSISFDANVTVSDESVTIKSQDFAVDRTDWDLSYNVEGTEGVPTDYLIANEIGFTIDVTISK